MKKIILLIVIPYVLVIAAVAYIFFGPGLMDASQELQWQGLNAEIPSGFKVKTYQSKGWTVYNMTKLFTNIRIALKSAFDVTNLPRHHKKVRFQYSPDPESVFYITNEHKAFLAVFVRNIGDTAVYFSVTTGSALASVSVLERVVKNAAFNGIPLRFPGQSPPLSVYLVDLIMLAGFVIPLLIIVFIFYYSGKRPKSHYFEGDPIRCEEKNVYFSSRAKWRRKNSFGYMVLTTTRFMVFVFRKPVWEIKMNQSDPDTRIDIDGKKIIIHQKDRKIVLKPADIQKWKDCLSNYM